MPSATLLFVHGTGVRQQSYLTSLKTIREKAQEFELPCAVQECLWGDALGVDFAGLCLPEPLKGTPAEEAQAARWEYLQIDPLFDLKLWSTPAAASPSKRVLRGKSSEKTGKNDEYGWELVRKYTPTIELKRILERYNVTHLFQPAWNAVMLTKLPESVFKAAPDESAAVARVVAEAVIAQMMHDGAEANPPETIPCNVRVKILDRLLYDWKVKEKGVKDLLLKVFGSATKTVVRPMRSRASRAVAPAIGDILRYQAVGRQIREMIHDKVKALRGPVFLCSHSLGGIACFELMVESKPSSVKGLITAGSQAALLYEFDALETLKGQQKLSPNFVPWLNLYDENDFLSYRADRVFGRSVDKRVDSLLPPLEAHSAYWKLDDTWKAIGVFVKRHL